MFEATARMKIRDGELDGFKKQAAEVMRLAQEKDTKTVRYDWFISDDGTECEVREAYTDADAMLDHSDNVGEARAKLFHDFADGHHMTFYGELSPGLEETLEKMGDHVEVSRFEFFQSLDVEAREEVPA